MLTLIFNSQSDVALNENFGIDASHLHRSVLVLYHDIAGKKDHSLLFFFFFCCRAKTLNVDIEGSHGAGLPDALELVMDAFSNLEEELLFSDSRPLPDDHHDDDDDEENRPVLDQEAPKNSLEV